MRLPKPQKHDSFSLGQNLDLASRLVKGGDEHAKAIRGINVYVNLEMQIGFMVEFDTYRIGVECLSSSSSMHTYLKGLEGVELAEKKQEMLHKQVYTREFMLSYQAIRRMYLQRQNHRHPDWQIFCRWVETLPFFIELINPQKGSNGQK